MKLNNSLRKYRSRLILLNRLFTPGVSPYSEGSHSAFLKLLFNKTAPCAAAFAVIQAVRGEMGYFLLSSFLLDSNPNILLIGKPEEVLTRLPLALFLIKKP